VKIVLDIENAKCSICLNLWHDVVTVAPCLHNFCNGCFSEWLRRSSSKSHDKSQSAACPQCRTAVQSVGRNHFLHNIEEAILQAFSSLQRSDEEIALLESYASVKSNIVSEADAINFFFQSCLVKDKICRAQAIFFLLFLWSGPIY